MKKIIVLNNGDLYGYIFTIFLLNSNKNINVEFVKLNSNSKYYNINYLIPPSVYYFKKYLIDILDNDITTKINATHSFNLLFKNFFKEQSEFFLVHDKINLKNIDINQLISISKNIDVFELLYPSVLLSKLNIYENVDLSNNYYINFSEDLLKEFILDRLQKFNNFKYVEINSLAYTEKLNDDLIYVDSTFDSILINNEYINYSDIFNNYSINRSYLNYENIGGELKNYSIFEFDSNKFIETNFLYSKKIITEYNFNNGHFKNKISKNFIKNNIISLGKCYANHNMSFLEQILNFYVIDKSIDIINNNDFRESKLKKVNDEFQYIFKNINYFIKNLFLFSKRDDSDFWKEFNTIDYYQSTYNYQPDLNVFYFSDNLYHLIKNLYFDYDYHDVEGDDINAILKLIIDLNTEKYLTEKHITPSFLNQYRYLKKYVYKEKEDISFELFKNIA